MMFLIINLVTCLLKVYNKTDLCLYYKTNFFPYPSSQAHLHCPIIHLAIPTHISKSSSELNSSRKSSSSTTAKASYRCISSVSILSMSFFRSDSLTKFVFIVVSPTRQGALCKEQGCLTYLHILLSLVHSKHSTNVLMLVWWLFPTEKHSHFPGPKDMFASVLFK